jgi:hypothetical protein
VLGPLFSEFPENFKLDFLMLGLLKRLSVSGFALLNERPPPSLLPKPLGPPAEGREALPPFELFVLFLIRNAVSLLDLIPLTNLPCN